MQWQRLQRWSIDTLIQLGPRTGKLAKGPLTQLLNQLQDGLVQVIQTEELALAQRRQHPTLNDLNSDRPITSEDAKAWFNHRINGLK
jgi:SAM-dependent MidA family methyltransferase